MEYITFLDPGGNGSDGLATQEITGTIVRQRSITGSIVQTGVRPAEIYMRLAASDDGDGIQRENITLNGVQPGVGTITKIELPLLNAIVEGQVGSWVVVLISKEHTTKPDSIDLELLAIDDPQDQDTFVPDGGSKTIAQALGITVGTATGDELTKEEDLVHVSFASMRTFNTLGTSGSLGLAVRINGGEDIDYDFLIRVNGKSLRSI